MTSFVVFHMSALPIYPCLGRNRGDAGDRSVEGGAHYALYLLPVRCVVTQSGAHNTVGSRDTRIWSGPLLSETVR